MLIAPGRWAPANAIGDKASTRTSGSPARTFSQSRSREISAPVASMREVCRSRGETTRVARARSTERAVTKLLAPADEYLARRPRVPGYGRLARADEVTMLDA